MGAIAKARSLRKRLTPAEARLWTRLRALRQDSLHFRRHHPERGYILDFVCLDRRLIVELDGGSHANGEGVRRDRVRDAVLGREGCVTMRCRNEAIRDRVEEVVEEVRMRRRALPTRSPLCADPPSPEGEGERL